MSRRHEVSSNSRSIFMALAASMIVGLPFCARPSNAQSTTIPATGGWQATTAAALPAPPVPATTLKKVTKTRRTGQVSTPRKSGHQIDGRESTTAPIVKSLVPTADAAAHAALPSVADKANPGVTASTECAQPAPAAAPAVNPAYTTAVQRFCASIGPTAIEARVAWQRRTIAELEKEIAIRIERLDLKIEEHKSWMAKREAFASKATINLLQMITKMKSEAAAQQLAEMEEDVAAALLMKLDPKVSGPLLGEIPASKAARLAGLIAASAELSARRAPPKIAPPVSPAALKEGGN